MALELPGARARKSEAVVGGGSLPGYSIPSWAVEVAVLRAQALASRLRTGSPPVICRVENDMLVFDLRTVPPEEDDRLLRAIRYAFEQG
jgi:L-seryl-tRNA(Ser) seleniumtransferase